MRSSARALALAGVCVGALAAAAPAAQRLRLEQSVDLAVPTAPVLIDVDGVLHLVYELHITNMRRERLALQRLQVRNTMDRSLVAELDRAALGRSIARPGAPSDTPDPDVVQPGRRTVVFLWLPLRGSPRRPSAVSHRLDLLVDDRPANTIDVESESTSISAEAVELLAPPLAGGPWIAIYDPLLIGGHRTALYTLAGKARIPGRFAIDFIRAPASGASVGEVPGRNSFGADVLAVADARVASLMDDMPDNPLDRRATPGPLPLEQASGNYVALDLGRGRFAFYEHLRRGSIAVKVGERVRAGQVIAALGSSGSTSIGPHLHFHVADANATLAADGRPFVFRRYRHLGAYRSLAALLAGEPWIPTTTGAGELRERQHPAAVAVVRF